jgi:peptidoglycan/xylan/chitin deacetylase (PgdA/CDA1 family)
MKFEHPMAHTLTAKNNQEIVARRFNRVFKAFLIGFSAFFLFQGLFCEKLEAGENGGNPAAGARVLLYHRFGPKVADSMTVTTPVFKSHLDYLKANGYTVTPLRTLVNAFLRKGPALPPKSVALVVDDGHITVYKEMLPLIKKYNYPVTLFIYPSAISNASYAMTWDQLRELKRTGLFDIQSHGYWHPNFKIEKKRLNPSEYEKFVDGQLTKSRKTLEKKIGGPVDIIGWPFGIFDDYLISRAVKAGYVAGFSIEAHPVRSSDGVMKLPRYLLTNANKGKDFEWIFRNTDTP